MTLKEEKDNLLSCRLFQKWKKKIIKNGCSIQNAYTLGVVELEDKFILRRLISVDYTCPDGIIYNRNILLKDDAVVVVPFFYMKGVQNFVVVEQSRVIDGKNSFEFPSGSVIDGLSPAESALQELKEETGIVVKKNRLITLAKNVVVCESAMSEKVTWFQVELKLNEIPDEGKLFGVLSQNERTKVVFLKVKDLERINSFHMLSALELIRRKKQDK